MAESRSITVTIRTVFEYGPTAVDSLINAYKEKNYSDYVECRFNPITHTFILEGDSGHAEPAFQEFMELMHRAIDVETTRNRALGDYAPIHRSRLTQLNSPAVMWSEQESGETNAPSRSRNNGTMSSNDPRYRPNNQSSSADTTSDYMYTGFWEPRITAADFSLMLHLHDGRSITNEIAGVCNCALFPDWEKRSVKIGANNRNVIEKVVRKLRKIEELFKRGFEPISVILLHPDEKKKFEFKLVSLSKQSELKRTTMFYNQSSWRKYGTDKMFLVRILEYSDREDRFVRCHVEIAPTWAVFARAGTEPRDWDDYRFSGWGSSDMNPLLALRRPSSADGPVNEGPPDLDPEDHIGQYNTPVGAAAPAPAPAMGGEPVNSHQTPPRVGGGFQLGSRPGTVDGDDIPLRRPTTGAIRIPIPRISKEPAVTKSKEDTRDARTEVQTEVSENMKDLASLQSGEPHTDNAGNVDDGGLSKASSVITGGFNLPERHLGTGIGRTVNVPGSFVEREPTTTTTPRTIRQPRARKPRANAGAPSESSKPPEKEGVSEVDTRDIQRTMRQRAPGRRGLHDGEDESDKLKQYNTRQLHDVITKSFEHVRSWQGHVTFEISLGRVILIDVPKSLSKHNIDWTEWQPSLSRSPEIKTIFTDLITNEFFDMEFVSDLKMSKAEMLFSPDHIKKRVTYEFHCNHKGKNRIMEIDARNFEPTIYGDQQAFGSVYWAHPLRSWDARFALAGAKVLDNETPVFKSLIESLFVPGDSAIPDISYLVRGRDFHVNRVVVKRETRRPCLSKKITNGQDIDLICKEEMEMVIQQHKFVREQFRAMANDRTQMMQEGLLSYSFALVPTKIEEALQENLKLEIGEEVQWTTGDLIGSLNEGAILPGLESLTFTVLKKTDDVGYNNNNGPIETGIM